MRLTFGFLEPCSTFGHRLETITQKGLALPITQKCFSTAHDYAERFSPPNYAEML